MIWAGTHMRSTSRRAGRGALALLVATLLAACGSVGPQEIGSSQPQGSSLRLTLGTKNFTESVITGELYAQALNANGFRAVLRKNIGPTETADKALTDGDIDAYPEYLGVAATVVAGEDLQGKSAEQTSQIARDFYRERGQAVSKETPFENTDAIATTVLYAQQNGLRTIGDLRKLSSFTLGARPEFETRQQGFAGMQRIYGLTNGQFRPLDIGATYNALDAGDVNVANVFSTDGKLANGDYRILEDTDRLFGFQHVALVIDQAKLNSLGGDRFMAVIDAVSAALSQQSMIEMNRAVDIDKQEPAAVAERFLRENGLLTAHGG